MIKTIPIRIDTSKGTANLVKGLSGGNWQCNTLNTLMRIGVLTAPPAYKGFHLSTLWAWLRYASAIDYTKTNLALNKYWNDVDPHQKNILADDFGMGFTCQYLIEKHNFKIFADTKFVLDNLFPPSISYRTVKKGKAKSPDFLALDNSNELHILECKGSQASPSSLQQAMYKGIDQKNNLKGAFYKSSMVGGIYVPLYGSKKNPELVFVDPEPDERLKALEKIDKRKIISAINRIYLSKILVTAGLWRTASIFTYNSFEQQNLRFRMTPEDELTFAGYRKLDDFFTKTIEYRSFELAERGEELAVTTSLEVNVSNKFITKSEQATKWIDSRYLWDDGLFEEFADIFTPNNVYHEASNYTSNEIEDSYELKTSYGISFNLTRKVNSLS